MIEAGFMLMLLGVIMLAAAPALRLFGRRVDLTLLDLGSNLRAVWSPDRENERLAALVRHADQLLEREPLSRGVAQVAEVYARATPPA